MNLKQKMYIGYIAVAILIGMVVWISMMQFLSFETRVNYVTRDVADQVKIIYRICTEILLMRTSVEKYIYLQKNQDMKAASETILRLDDLLKNDWTRLFSHATHYKSDIEKKYSEYTKKFQHISVRFKAIDYQKQRLKTFSNSIMDGFKTMMVKIKDNHNQFVVCVDALSAFVHANTYIHNYLITHDESPLKESKSYLMKTQKILETDNSDGFDDLIFDVADYQDDFEGISDIIHILDKEIDLTIIPLASQIITLTQEIANNRWMEMDNSRDIIDHNARLTKKILLIIGMIAISLEILLGFILSKTIIRQITKIVEFAEKVAHGDLSKTLDVTKKDELGVLLSAINLMVTNFKGLAKNIQNKSHILFNTSNNMVLISNRLSVNSEQMTNRTQQLASNSVQMNANVNQIALSIDDISSNVEDVSNTTGNISNHIHEVTQAIQSFSESMHSIHNHAKKGVTIAGNATDLVGESETRLDKLRNAANEIGGVTNTIKRIATKTNLIALNASIEASTAGEYGKGFSVVADAIQKFSDQSKQAAEDIHSRISGVQENTQNVISIITEISDIIVLLRESIEVITESVNNQAGASNTIFSNITLVNQGIDEIACHMKELVSVAQDVSQNANDAAQSVEGVHHNIQGVNLASAASHAEAKEVLTTSNELSNMSNELSQLVSTLKI